MRIADSLGLWLGGLVLSSFALAQSSFKLNFPAELLALQTHALPGTPLKQLSASEIYQLLAAKSVMEREKLAVALLEAGHFPENLRQLQAVTIKSAGYTLSFWVMPDYLSIGNSQDAMLMPLSFNSARRLANSWGYALPTRKMVDAIYQQATRIIWPRTYRPSPQMNSMETFLDHSQWIDGQRYLFSDSSVLTAGHKKDVVLSRRLTHNPKRQAIYGWQNIREGEPIQPLSIWHGDHYIDYSHGLRMVAPWVVVNGTLLSLREVLLDAQLARLLSDEGPLDIDRLLQRYPSTFANNL